jgi:hypothetical protein
MAAAAITVSAPVAGTPLEATYVAAHADGNTILPPSSPWLLHMKNAGTAKVMTVVTPKTESGLSVADKVINIAGTKEFFLNGATFLPSDLFVDPTTGLITFTTDSQTSLTFAIIPA